MRPDPPSPSRPNVVVVLADDLGYSDLGCYGGELRTPTLDRLAARGVRLTGFANTARCSPSRASLLTGLHPHQTGIGILTNDDRPRGYPGSLNRGCVTMAEVLRDAGYATCLTGKWHLASDVRRAGDAWPTRRGFDHFFGTLTGCGSYYQPGTLTRGEAGAGAEALEPGFYYTDAISEEAAGFVRRQHATRPDQPFLLYVAYTAPHWPLHAPEEDVGSYEGVFDAGWDALRAQRLERLLQMGVVPPGTRLSPRDAAVPAWADVGDKAWQLRRMQTYAAQVQRMDAGLGRVVAALEETGCLDSTLLVFLSDNGASPEELPLVELERFRRRTDIVPAATRDGRAVHVGNDPAVPPGGEDTYASYGRGWASLSNTPFRRYKQWTHQGGIAAPCIVHWPAGGVAGGRLVEAPFQLTHVLPTVLEAAGVAHPGEHAGRPVAGPEAASMLAALRGGPAAAETLFWEHVGNAALRQEGWKLVREHGRPWELYDLDADPTELVDLARDRPRLVGELAAEWDRWAKRVGVIPFEETLALYRERGLTAVDAAG